MRVAVEQTALEMAQISWTSPSSAPERYQIIITSTLNDTIKYNTTALSFQLSLQPGVYSMQLVALSSINVYEVPSAVEFTVQGMVLDDRLLLPLTNFHHN